MSDPVVRLDAALEGRYTIERELGEGGMATVYLAEDLKHSRRVALKVLKPELAAIVGAERFLAEIKTTANLQHPHILPLHDSGDCDGFLYYVMPYVEGESLRDRLDRERQLPVDEAVRIATDLAEALDYAHRQKVIHRDIKPANIMMHEGRPLIADFGIALAVGAAGGARLTETGLSVGTPYYMSPEQATGDSMVGPQSDTYALGCVLYEMLVGEPPYPGATAQAVLGKIITGGPVSATEQRPMIPAHVDAAIRRSLEKLPADRFTTAQEFANALVDPGFRHGADGPHAEAIGTSSTWNRVTTAISAVAAVLALTLGWTLTRPDPPTHIERFGFARIADEQLPLGALAIGPAGSGIVFLGTAATGGGGVQLWYRRWDNLEATPLPASGAALGQPSISPDGREVAFVAGGELRVAPLAGGVPRTLADSAICCTRWGSDGFVYFSPVGRHISRVPAAGGQVEEVTERLEEGDGVHGFFEPIPGSRSAIFTVWGSPTRIEGMRLDTGERIFLTEGIKGHVTPTGHLVFGTQDGQILAAPFDADALGLTGPAVPLVEDVFVDNFNVPRFDVNVEGTLVYWFGQGGNSTEMVWAARSGAVTPVDPDWGFDPGGGNRGWALSPDGSKVAIRVRTDAGNDIWIKELDDGPLTRLTFDEGEDRDPRWLDNRTLTFLSAMNSESNDYNLWTQRADGTGQPELILDYERSISEAFVSPDGESVIFRSTGIAGQLGGRDILDLQLDGDGTPRSLLATEFDESAPLLSPDGRWLAYQSNESGRDEVYVRPYPDTDAGRWQVSADGGLAPLWSRDGTELFFISPDRTMMSAPIETDPTFRVTSREPLFQIGPEFLIGDRTTQYDVSDDGRFLMIRAIAGTEGASRVVLVRNWFEELRERVGN